MDYSTLYLFISFVLLGILIVVLNFITRKSRNRKDTATEQEQDNIVQSKKEDVKPVSKQKSYVRPEGCCGLHEVCEKESLLMDNSEIIYFADEELDTYKGRQSDDYNSEEIAEFEDVLFTLKENEVSEWLKSLQLRGINPPDSVKDEALMIISERRQQL